MTEASVVSFEKPVEHIGLADWYAKQWQNQQTNDTRRNDSFKLRYDSKQLRNETRIRTEWDVYHSNARLADRVSELERWKNVLEACLERVQKEMRLLKDERLATERELDAIGVPLSVISECITMRDSRRGAELTYDDGDTELKKELCTAEISKKALMERSQATWEKLNRMEEVCFKLKLDINDKTEAIEIDKEQLMSDSKCANISFKTDPLRIPKGSIPYETWLEHSRYTKLLADTELLDTCKLREALFVARERVRNDMQAQRDCVDFTLRKRIYETQRARNELEWQSLKMCQEMEILEKEIHELDAAIEAKQDSLKLCETRLESRTYRPGIELTHDEVESGLKDEVVQIRQTTRDLEQKLNCTKATYNALAQQQTAIDIDLDNKRHSLMTDIRCLDLRVRLHTEKMSDTDRNLTLIHMQDEIPPN